MQDIADTACDCSATDRSLVSAVAAQRIGLTVQLAEDVKQKEAIVKSLTSRNRRKAIRNPGGSVNGG